MDDAEIITADPNIMSGIPVFRGTRVPVAVLFDNLTDGMRVDEILESWSDLDRADVLAVLRLAHERVVRPAASGHPAPDPAPPGLARGGVDLAAGDAWLRKRGVEQLFPFVAADFDDPLPDEVLQRPLPRR